MAWWRNLEKWLRRDFKVELLLDCQHRVFTPTGDVATQWQAVVRALTTLVLEVMDMDVDEEGYSALFEHDALPSYLGTVGSVQVVQKTGCSNDSLVLCSLPAGQMGKPVS